jgi:hypothetical protein
LRRALQETIMIATFDTAAGNGAAHDWDATAYRIAAP